MSDSLNAGNLPRNLLLIGWKSNKKKILLSFTLKTRRSIELSETVITLNKASYLL